MARIELTFESNLAVSPAAAWSWATSAAGIRNEMAPLLSMSLPDAAQVIGRDTPLGAPILRSRLALFGILPIDHSDLTIVELEPGRRFLERSPMRSMRHWEHERTIERTESGCLLRDRLCFEPRFGGLLVRFFVKRFFEHRHAVLRRHLGPKRDG